MGQAKQRRTEIEQLKARGNRVKELGQVFTPFPLVKEMLDKIPSFDEPVQTLMWKTILEPSFGNGQFILGVIRKLMDAYAPQIGEDKIFRTNAAAFSHILEVQLYGFEIDPLQRAECIDRIIEMAVAYGITNKLSHKRFSTNNNLIVGNCLTADTDTCFIDNMKNWGPFNATTKHQLFAAIKYRLSAVSTPSYFNPADIDCLDLYMKKAA